MRILQINNETYEDIAKVLKYADEHRFTTAMMKLVMSGDLEPAGDNPDFLVHIHDGYRVIYSLEELQPMGWYHHISISVDQSKKYPHEMAVQMILEAFKMEKDLKMCAKKWLDKNTESVNILQVVDDNDKIA